MNTMKALLRSSIVLYFVIAFEVLIMISPFAGFFYSVFNPVLLNLASRPSTRWLSAFYLPHMVLPQDGLLQFVRVMGSVLFVAGVVVFLVCAAQIYTAKFTKKGAVLGGLYAHIRHPQYLALGIAGLGLSVLWPRFLTIVLWILMTIVYYFLARDEERRMLNSHEATYRDYMSKTGMFLPHRLEQVLMPSSGLMKTVFLVGFVAATLGCAALLRMYTINTLTMWTGSKNVAAVAILPEDGMKMDHRMADILATPEVKSRLQDSKQYLVYFLPQNYIMQGMIADTGGDWKLYKQHHSVALITDWIFHPFRHLQEGHHGMHEMHTQQQGADFVRRLIFLSIEEVPVRNPRDLFSINALRVPQFMVDVDVHTLQIVDARELSHGSGWGTVPTPVF
ncbi:MAG TPA: isoprenylcysteine carboxylmethyltransferase family protein [Nitrospirota bacterium]|nr:isoprenylcysteine carboxylmethyltransferase family protein [Nitrospirota bacterium]